jgi:tetratricopeptide (TPR) repeat protein
MTQSNDLPDFDGMWNYQRPAETQARFRELLPAAERSQDRSYRLQLLTQIARAQGLQRRYDDAHATLDQVRDQLTDDSKLARVRYLLERGRCHRDTNQTDRAKESFLKAWELAQAAGFDSFAVDAAHMMGIVEPGERGLEWNLRAMEHAKASADPKARRWAASLLNNIGWTYHSMGKYAEALEVFEEALKLRVEQGKAEPIRVARWSVAKMHRLLGRVAEALATQRELCDECEAAGEPDGFVFEEMAECLLALNRPEEARASFARAYELLSKDEWFAKEEPQRLERIKRIGGLA